MLHLSSILVCYHSWQLKFVIWVLYCWKTQDGRMTKKCRARPRMHNLARHFLVILPSLVFQPSSVLRYFCILQRTPRNSPQVWRHVVMTAKFLFLTKQYVTCCSCQRGLNDVAYFRTRPITFIVCDAQSLIQRQKLRLRWQRGYHKFAYSMTTSCARPACASFILKHFFSFLGETTEFKQQRREQC